MKFLRRIWALDLADRIIICIITSAYLMIAAQIVRALIT